VWNAEPVSLAVWKSGANRNNQLAAEYAATSLDVWKSGANRNPYRWQPRSMLSLAVWKSRHNNGTMPMWKNPKGIPKEL
tara:strand:+ start:1425 stop:1661 length:237 start_codon:yes stop_codon:yes gene_type:complete